MKRKELIVGGDNFENVVTEMALEGIGTVGNRVANKRTAKGLRKAMHDNLFGRGGKKTKVGGVVIAEARMDGVRSRKLGSVADRWDCFCERRTKSSKRGDVPTER